LFGLLSSLSKRRGHAFAKQATLADKMGCKPRQIRNYLTALKVERCGCCYAVIDKTRVLSCQRCSASASVSVALVSITAPDGLKAPRHYHVHQHPNIAPQKPQKRQHSATQKRQHSAGQSGNIVPTEIMGDLKINKKDLENEAKAKNRGTSNEMLYDMFSDMSEEDLDEFREWLAKGPMAAYLCSKLDSRDWLSQSLLSRLEDYINGTD